LILAEREGFEPPDGYQPSTVFKTVARFSTLSNGAAGASPFSILEPVPAHFQHSFSGGDP
jgi:hypothetical protein